MSITIPMWLIWAVGGIAGIAVLFLAALGVALIWGLSGGRYR